MKLSVCVIIEVIRLKLSVWSYPFEVIRLKLSVWSYPFEVIRLKLSVWSYPFEGSVSSSLLLLKQKHDLAKLNQLVGRSVGQIRLITVLTVLLYIEIFLQIYFCTYSCIRNWSIDFIRILNWCSTMLYRISINVNITKLIVCNINM